MISPLRAEINGCPGGCTVGGSGPGAHARGTRDLLRLGGGMRLGQTGNPEAALGETGEGTLGLEGRPAAAT
ncbi:hypothetical protein NDU88_005416 [Pleurodeles waltl]|uniref:Uncharacterized protein n=1 Tax=Pleurodeles waltl TaxID=8319 RepID=A0AAV7TVJ2_PLEWA|nr:hypothetical protein NDU88_005416 [Pleurodeles waltl]